MVSKHREKTGLKMCEHMTCVKWTKIAFLRKYVFSPHWFKRASDTSRMDVLIPFVNLFIEFSLQQYVGTVVRVIGRCNEPEFRVNPCARMPD